MTYAKLGDSYVIRLERGEEVLSKLVEFAAAKELAAGAVTAIGAVEDVTLGYFDVVSKEYRKETLEGSYEVVSLQGTLGRKEGQPMYHLHAVVADQEHRTRGGHLFSARVSVTLEVHLQVLPGALGRSQDSFSGLQLLDLPDKM